MNININKYQKVMFREPNKSLIGIFIPNNKKYYKLIN
jgi:hypothetical protein